MHAPTTIFRRKTSALARSLLLLLAALLVCDSALAKRRSQASEPTIVTQARSLARSDRLEAIAVLEDYLASDPSPDLVPWVALNAGEQRRLINDLKSARAHFTAVRDGQPEHFLRDAAILGITLASCGEGPSGNQLATLGYLGTEGVPPTMDADRYRLLAQAALDEGQRAAKVRALATKAFAYAGGSGDELVIARVQRSMSRFLDLDSGKEATETNPEEQAADSLVRAQQALSEGDYGNAKRIAESFIATFPASPGVAEAQYVIARAQAGDPVHPRQVGVLLPLSGTYGTPGQRLLEVIELANRHSNSPMVLLPKDTEGDPGKTVALLEEMVLEKGVVAVLGPLLKDNAQVAASAAQALHVPLVTLTQSEGITSERDFVFRGFLTRGQQVRALLDHVMGVMGLSRFAVLAPDNSYGQVSAQLFAAEVLQREGTVQDTVYYDPTLGDFRKAAQELASKDYKERASEWYQLKAAAKRRGMDPDKVVLPPKVDFEAIFIPDNHQRVQLVASSLAYEEFAIGDFKPRRSDVPLVLLGLNGWHNDRLALDGGRYVRHSVLVDAFDARGDTLVNASFVESFGAEFSRKPGVVDALGYDVGRMVALAVASGVDSRDAMRAALLEVELPDTVTGGKRFDEQREVQRSLLILQVGEERIEPWRERDEEDVLLAPEPL